MVIRHTGAMLEWVWVEAVVVVVSNHASATSPNTINFFKAFTSVISEIASSISYLIPNIQRNSSFLLFAQGAISIPF